MSEAHTFLAKVTPVMLTFDEAPNVRRSLSKLTEFREVLVIDSGSQDGTLSILSEFPNVRVVTRSFDSFASQWNFAMGCEIETEWALGIDADYILTDGFLSELASLNPSAETVAYKVRFTYCVFGRELSGTLYPPLVALHRHRLVHYVQDGHCMRAQIAGKVGNIAAPIQHDDRKPLDRWLKSQCRYAEEEAELLLSRDLSSLTLKDRIRKMVVISPWLVPLYCLSVGRGFLDGWPGIFYALQRGVAEAILGLKLIEARLYKRS